MLNIFQQLRTDHGKRSSNPKKKKQSLNKLCNKIVDRSDNIHFGKLHAKNYRNKT